MAVCFFTTTIAPHCTLQFSLLLHQLTAHKLPLTTMYFLAFKLFTASSFLQHLQGQADNQGLRIISMAGAVCLSITWIYLHCTSHVTTPQHHSTSLSISSKGPRHMNSKWVTAVTTYMGNA